MVMGLVFVLGRRVSAILGGGKGSKDITGIKRQYPAKKSLKVL